MESADIAQTILQAIRNLHYGTLEIVVHDSKVVRIERRERIRLDVDPEAAKHPKNPSTSQ